MAVPFRTRLAALFLAPPTNSSGQNNGTISSYTLSPPPADKSVKVVYDLPAGQTLISENGVCGHVTFPPAATTNDTVSANFQSGLQQASQDAWETMRKQAATFAQQNLVYFIPQNLGGQEGVTQTPMNDQGGLQNIINQYQNALQAAVGANTDFSQAMLAMAATSSLQGWVSAGAWFNTVARIQSEMMDVSALVPATTAPDITQQNNAIFKEVAGPALDEFEQWLDAELPGGAAAAAAVRGQ